MTIKIILFAGLRDLIGHQSISVQLPHSCSVKALLQELKNQFPTAENLINRSSIAVNHEYAEDDFIISENDEIAIIPPVSGG